MSADGQDGRAHIGVLALQGAFYEHLMMLRSFPQVIPREIRSVHDLNCAPLDALVIPGGESTVMGMVAERSDLLPALRDWLALGKPVFGTCSGMIMLANKALHSRKEGQVLFGGLNITVDRNYFGTQLQSFERKINVPILQKFTNSQQEELFNCVFIRAPAVLETDAKVQILASLKCEKSKTDKEIAIAVRQGNILATAFHPELTRDNRFHRYFLEELVLPHVLKINSGVALAS
eukprot:Sdes_comp21942_c0_seq1m20484